MGFDATFLNNSLIVNADYFYKRTKDILLRPVVAGVFGGSLPSQNRGEMSNKGWEVTLAYNLNTKNWKHRFSLNVADSKNELLKYGDPSINTNDNVTCITAEGFPLNSYYGYKVDHYFKNMEEIENSAVPTGYTVMPGDVKYVDQNGDEIIDEKDRVVLGNGFPRYTFGFTYNVEWKGFDFSVLFQGVGKRDRMVRGELIEPFHSNYSYTMYNHQLDYWTLENTDARWPRLSSPGSASNTNNYHVLGGSSDLYMLNGAYVRCKNIQLGYTLPVNIAGKLGCKSVKMYVNAQNLFTICKDGFVDPESSELGSNMSFGSANSARNYPMLKYYGFGLDLTF
nr:TonB-dependent receptor [uncultured Bacteroides sp.]